MDVGVGHLKAKHGHSDLAAWDSLLHGRGHFLCKHDHVGELVVVDVKDIVHLLLGHDKRVTPVHRIYIKESVEFIILRHLIRGISPAIILENMVIAIKSQF